jgi:hypothetical protein
VWRERGAKELELGDEGVFSRANCGAISAPATDQPTMNKCPIEASGNHASVTAIPAPLTADVLRAFKRSRLTLEADGHFQLEECCDLISLRAIAQGRRASRDAAALFIGAVGRSISTTREGVESSSLEGRPADGAGYQASPASSTSRLFHLVSAALICGMRFARSYTRAMPLRP